jgi:hypothetical protein
MMRVKNKRILKNGAIAGYVYYPSDKKWKWRIIGRSKKGGVHPNNVPIPNWMSGNNINNNSNIKKSNFKVIRGTRYFVIYKPTKRIFYFSTGTSNIFNYPDTWFPCFCEIKKNNELIKFLSNHNGRISKCVLGLNKSFIIQLLDMNKGKELIAVNLKKLYPTMSSNVNYKNNSNKNTINIGKINKMSIVDGRDERFPWKLEISLQNKEKKTYLQFSDVLNSILMTFLGRKPSIISPSIFVRDDNNQVIGIEDDIYNLLGIIPFLLKFNNWEDLQLSSLLGGYWEKIPHFRNFVQTHDYLGNEFIKRSTKLKNIEPKIQNNFK